MDSNNFVKLIALSIVGGVAKALFAPPRIYNTSPIVRDAVGKVADAAVDAATKG